MFKTSFFINISKRYLIYILRLFLYTSNLFIKYKIFYIQISYFINKSYYC